MKAKSKIKPNTCPYCGERLRKMVGMLRCEKDNYTAPFEGYGHEEAKWGYPDSRPRDLGWVMPIPPAE